MLVIKQFGPVTYAMGTLQEILAGTGIATKVRALPNDVAGCTLEMGVNGLWTGNLGTLTRAQANALVAAGALAKVQIRTPAEIGGNCARWTGAAWQSALDLAFDRTHVGEMPAFIGDSITDGTGAPYNLGWVETVVFSLGVLRTSGIPYRFGVAGQRSDEINARLPGVLALGFKNLFYMAGANDAAQLITLATFAANITSAISTALGSGCRIFVCTPTPASTAKSAASRKLLAQYYAWLMANVERLGGVLVDTTTPLLDPATGNILASCNYDGTHPNTLGHNNIAAAVVAKALPYFNFRAYSGVSVSQINAIQDPAVQTAGPLTTGWALGLNSGLTLTPAVVTASDGSKWQEFGISAAASGFANYLCNTTLDLVVGDTYAIAFDAEIEVVSGDLVAAINLNTTFISFELQTYGTILAPISDRRFPAKSQTNIYKARCQFKFVSVTSSPDVNLQITVQLNSALSVKVRVTSMSIMDLTALGLA